LEAAVALDAYGAVSLGACVNNVGCAGFYRAIGISTSPANSVFDPISTVTGVSVAAIGAQAATNGADAVARVDVAGIKFKTPADTSDNNNRALSFYFGYLGVAGSWDNKTQTAAVAGALAEVVSVLGSINVWYDNDNTAGFNWDITQTDPTKKYDIFDNAIGVQKGYDTIDTKGTIDLNNLTWTPISHSKVQCNTQIGLTNASDKCEIHSLTTSGLSGLSTVITITARIATQPVLVNGAQNGPDRIKFDVRVQYPWTTMSAGLYNSSRAKLALISFAAGKSGAFVGAAVKRADQSDSLVFASGSTSSAYYAYKQSCKVDGADAAVTTQVVTGQQILDYDCTGAPCAGVFGLGTTNLVALVLKIKVGWLQAFGWKSAVAFHSLGTTTMPADIDWDPEVGSTSTVANSAALAAPSLVLLAFFLF